MSGSAGTAVRVGVWGIGREGRHALEAFVAQEGLTIAGACDADPSRRDGLPEWIRLFSTADALLESADVDAVAISDEAATADVACAVLAAGKVVILTTPVQWTLREMDALRRSATASRKAIVLLAQEALSADFQTAEAALERPEMGPVRHVHYALWSPPVIAGSAWSEFHACCDRQLMRDRMLAREAGRIAALARLIRERPVEVRCAIIAEQTREDEGFLNGGEFALDVRFESGAAARLEVNRRTCLTHATGWVVSGTGGGYRKGRFFQVTRDGEIFDVPQSRPSPEADLRSRLSDAIRGIRTDCDWLLRTATLVRAARTSAETGQAVTRLD
ncbi:MAG: Gfo/Idh/MocA family oxidoreductase [Planctomycetaceae bacterium]|nr:Gfo/Idh/MocA family oxidoreductase [Planctomycetaceae bacterium]